MRANNSAEDAKQTLAVATFAPRMQVDGSTVHLYLNVQEADIPRVLVLLYEEVVGTPCADMA
jgi:hypothetical protein